MLRRNQPFVYFVRRADGEGPVKIGCSESPQLRLDTLGTWSPYPLALVVQTPGDEALEQRFHTLFRDHHSHREWFRPSLELDLLMAQLRAGSFDFTTLPDIGKRLPSRQKRARAEHTKLSARLKMRLYHGCLRHGITVPRRINDIVEAVFRGEAVDAKAIAAVEQFVADPLEHGGKPYPFDWARPKFAAYLRKRNQAAKAA